MYIFTVNDEPGGIYAIEDSKDATSGTAETVFEPKKGQKEFRK